VADGVDDGGESRAAKGCDGRRSTRIRRPATGTLSLAHSHRLTVEGGGEGRMESEDGRWPTKRALGGSKVGAKRVQAADALSGRDAEIETEEAREYGVGRQVLRTYSSRQTSVQNEEKGCNDGNAPGSQAW
jgi:hypothetical protein